MTREEKIVLLEIDSLYNKMLEEPNVKGKGKYMQKPNGYNYAHNARKMRDKVFELYKIFKPEYLTEKTIAALDHTFNKEVLQVEDLYNRSIKNNAPKKYNAEFLNSMSKSNRQIETNLILVFKKIKETLKDL